MPHIPLPDGVPGIRSALQYRPETAKPLLELAETLLRGPSSLTSAEREMIAAFVSARNDCHFCHASHRAAAAHHLGGDYSTVDAVRADYLAAPVSAKLKALLTSGYSEHFLQSRSSVNGSVPLLNKPYRANQLGKAIRGVLDREKEA